MAKSRRTFLTLTSVLALAAGTSTAWAETAITVSVAVYSDKTAPFFEQVAADFMAENPDITVRIDPIPWDSLYQRLTTDISAGTAPDASIIGTRWLPDFASGGIAEPLDGYMSDAFKASFIDVFLEPSTIEGQTMGLPVAASARAMFVNDELLARAGVEVPTTWDQLYDASRAVADKTDAYGFALMGTGIETDAYYYYGLWSFGGDILNAEGQSGLGSPEAIEAASFYMKMLEGGATQPSPTNYDQTAVFSLFKRGEAAFVFSYPMLVPQLLTDSPDLKFSIHPIPAATAQATYGVTDTMMMFSSSQAKEATWKFLEYFYQDKYRAQFDEGEGFLPVTKNVAALPTFQDNPMMKPFIDVLPMAKFAPLLGGWEEIADGVVRNLQQMYMGSLTPEQAMTQAATEADAIIARSN